ncbi:MAG: NAD(P)-dependent oxidoreductase [Bacteroidota bacterium]
MKVSFIGLGIMGSRMAANLLKNGVDLTVYNRSKEIVTQLVEQGATAAATPQEAVKEADIVITMLSKPEVVEALAFGEQGFVGHMKTNALWVDSSTVNPSFTSLCAEKAKAHHIRYVDAPVAGTKPHAANAELVFFVGGSETDVAELNTLFDHMGRKTIHVGEVSKGASLKMLVNALLAQSMLMFSESVILGEKMGLDKQFLLNLLPNLVVSAPFTKAKAEMIKEDAYEVQFPLEWMQKDLQLVAQTAYELDQPLYLANIAKEVYQAAKQKGLGRLDFAAIHKYLSDQ